MQLSTQTDVLGRRYDDETAIRKLAEVGFDAYDISFFRMFSQPEYWPNQDSFREEAARLRAVSEQCGIRCNQAHAPFASSTGEPVRDAEIFQSIVRSMEAAAIMGAENIIVHPVQHLPYVTHAAELKEMNLEFYGRLIPYCQQFGIHVACENMWQRSAAKHTIVDSVCSKPEEFCDYLDTLNSPWIVGCLDVGHVILTDEDLPHFVRTMGKKRLRALHVHDNELLHDSHSLPFVMEIDFPAFAAALGEIGYEGDFTFEADNFLKKLPIEVEDEALRLMHRVGRHLISLTEQAK